MSVRLPPQVELMRLLVRKLARAAAALFGYDVGAEVELQRLERASARGAQRPLTVDVNIGLTPIPPRRTANPEIRRPVSPLRPVFAALAASIEPLPLSAGRTGAAAGTEVSSPWGD